MNDKTAKAIGTIRPGSRIAFWKPNGILEGIIEVNPKHPPRFHYLDGRPPADFEPVKVPVMVPPRHEHMHVIPGQDCPRDIARIAERAEFETKWLLPDTDCTGSIEVSIGKQE